MEEPFEAQCAVTDVTPQPDDQSLSWSKSGIKSVKYNKAVSTLMSNDPAFHNWIRSMVMVHADNGQFETVCNVPDQWRDELETITIVTANGIERGKGVTHQVSQGIYHVCL